MLSMDTEPKYISFVTIIPRSISEFYCFIENVVDCGFPETFSMKPLNFASIFASMMLSITSLIIKTKARWYENCLNK